jgi:hypothetical protein
MLKIDELLPGLTNGVNIWLNITMPKCDNYLKTAILWWISLYYFSRSFVKIYLMSNNNQEGKSFTAPVYLFSDPIVLSQYLEEHYPGEMEAVPLTADKIAIMEVDAG